MNFLEKYKVEGKGVKHTHTTFGQPWSKYNIPYEKNKKFVKLYSKLINKMPLHMIERPKKVGPLMIDIDWRFKKKYKERRYTLDDIKLLITKTTKVLKKHYRCSRSTLDNFLGFVFEKPHPTKDVKSNGTVEYKDGLHIVYPYMAMSQEMRYYIINEIKNEVRDAGAFSHMKSKSDFEKDVFDMCVIKSNGWVMYKSHKDNGQVYELKKIYRYNLEEVDLDEYDEKDRPALFGNRQYSEEDAIKISYKRISKEELDEKINIVLDKYNAKKKSAKKKYKVKISLKSMDNNSDVDKSNIWYEPTPSDKKLAPLLVNILSKERASDYNSWIYIGWALHNTSRRLLDTWLNFSKKCPGKYDENACIDVWNKARGSGLTIASLHMWAKQDNPEEYTKILRENIDDRYIKAQEGTHNDLAKLIYELYKHIYKCVSKKHKTWYEFQEHRWVEVEQGYTLKRKISDDLTTEFAKLNKMHFSRAAEDIDAIKRDNALTKADNVMKIIKQLKMASFKKHIMTECEDLFYDRKFEERLNSKKHLLGFDNGVYDLENMFFRPGTPDDYISMSTGYYYREYSMEDEAVKGVINFFKQVQIESVMREYILTLLASFLDGLNEQQKFIIWIGTGSNAKSCVMDFFTKAMGDYSGVLPSTVITKKKGGSSNATPEIAMLRGVRFVVIQEPEGNDKIHVGYMKELTGGDRLMSRAMYREPFYFIPQFKLLLTCNKLPFIPSNDEGTWRRIRVSPFGSEFVDLDKNGKHWYTHKKLKFNQFPKDNKMMRKLGKWNKAFMWLLINKYYKQYKENNMKIVEPEKVTIYTKRYQKSSDRYFEFLSEHLDKTNRSKDAEEIGFIYSMFKTWYKESYNNICPSRKEFLEYLVKHDYKLKRNKIIGVRVVDDDTQNIAVDLDAF
uniref:D5-like helicase-primase n=1 Tax=Mimivirus LCMiAC01 TaxID=2506608 RepID=A0A481Z0G3_9VIRU|nr:MAG: D5-like helicase-primase [Mimivirus LCMiAC01]